MRAVKAKEVLKLQGDPALEQDQPIGKPSNNNIIVTLKKSLLLVFELLTPMTKYNLSLFKKLNIILKQLQTIYKKLTDSP